MNSYILIVLADVFLASMLVSQKKYQKRAGISLQAGLIYNLLIGLFSSVMFLFINRFDINITGFSLVMAAAFSTIVMTYTFIAFRLMKKGNMSIYSLFLLSGGMIFPYFWGVLFLNERLTLLRTIGLVAILAAIVISNWEEGRANKKQIFMCTVVFLLNGFACIISKAHQISPASEVVTAADFAFLVAITRTILCSVILLIKKKSFVCNEQTNFSVKPVIFIVLIAAISDGLSYMFQLLGADNLPASVLFPLVTGGSVILSSLAGLLVLKEKLTPRQWFGIAICFAGTLMFL